MPLVDDGARERIRSDVDANLCVEAGAGTGKTTVLVDRVANLLASGRVTAAELAVITFTEKAAAELATRVRDELERRASEADGAGEHATAGRLRAAAGVLHRAHIETIHAFATALLRERPVEAGIDPRFEVLDTLGGKLGFDAAYERFERELMDTPHEGVELALRRGFGLKELRQTCACLHEHRYLLPLRIPPFEHVDVAGLVAEHEAIAEALRELLRRHSPGDDRAVPIVEGIVAWIDDLARREPLERERMLLRDPPRTRLNVGTDAAWGGEKARMLELQRAFRDLFERGASRLRTESLMVMLPHAERFAVEYAAERKAAGRADFDDLLFWARDLVRDDGAARTYFRRRFRALLIDEFQDTDPVQAELALLLASDGDPGPDWRDLRPGPGRLTVVGDPKQSIYRFRRADIAVYDAVKDGPLAGGLERITTNFRSAGELLTVLNARFDAVLQAEPGVQPGNVALEAPPDLPAAAHPPVVFAEGAFAGSREQERCEEARVIAALLHRMREERRPIRDRRDGNRLRPCRWGDMAILLPARTGIERFEEALATAGVPYRHEGARDFFQRGEVRDLLLVLGAIDDPNDRLALVGALRSSAFGLSDDDLVLHVAGGGRMSYRAPQPGPHPPVAEALAELEDLHRARRGLSLPELVRRVVDRTRLVEFALTLPGGAQAAANLLAVVDQARMFARAGGGGLRPFIRHLRESVEHEASEVDASVAEETDDVVRIMTMHGAKGLEFPIVALANLGNASSPAKGPVPREAEAFLHLRIGTERTPFLTPGYDEAWEREQHQFEAERLRLLYVAATRARDHLVIPCVTGRAQARGLLTHLAIGLPDDPALVERVATHDLAAPEVTVEHREAPTPEQVATAEAERGTWVETRADLRRRAGEERPLETASSRERAQGPLAAEVATFEATLLVRDGPPIPIGDAVHMVMERVSLPGGEDLAAIAEDVCLEGDIAAHRDEVEAMCRACLDSAAVRTALASRGWWREVPFAVARPAIGPGALATGRVDLVYRDGDELVVVDYKTDGGVTPETAEAHAIRHHSGQAEVYAEALSAATGLAVRAVVFVYCRAGVEVRLTPAAAGAAAT